MADTQNYSNHTRWFPLVHFILFPLLIINFLCHLVRLFMAPSLIQALWMLLSIVFMLMVLAARQQALKAQDRVIRLEERLRYREILSDELAARTAGLSSGQIIALRFAPDDELPGLIERTLNGEFAKTKDIKMAIKNWRADDLRV